MHLYSRRLASFEFLTFLCQLCLDTHWVIFIIGACNAEWFSKLWQWNLGCSFVLMRRDEAQAGTLWHTVKSSPFLIYAFAFLSFHVEKALEKKKWSEILRHVIIYRLVCTCCSGLCLADLWDAERVLHAKYCSRQRIYFIIWNLWTIQSKRIVEGYGPYSRWLTCH